MKKIIDIDLTPEEAYGNKDLRYLIEKKISCSPGSINDMRVLKRSIDARRKKVVIHQTMEIWLDEKPQPVNDYEFNYTDVKDKKRIIIAGAGPAGLFAALRLIELGLKPVIIERGKTVEERKFDIAAINRKRIVNPDSNYCFGEGGAGAYSDGKLYTRSNKRGDVKRILNIFHQHGATDDILFDTHPHIGTDKLPGIISAIRNTILNHGGEIHFGQRIKNIIISNGKARGVESADGNQFSGEAVILATGHSANDVYELLDEKNIKIEAKPFALGFRMEHPQQLIDNIQYNSKEKDPFLLPATYSLAAQVEGRGVFTFCMCPGGSIINAATTSEGLVLNGMSNSRRSQPFANAGIVATVDENDFKDKPENKAMAGLYFRNDIEKQALLAGGGNFSAPAQRLCDFMDDKFSALLNESSYRLGLKSVELNSVLSPDLISCLKGALKVFGGKMKGLLTNEATLLGVETRTSSPVRITRDEHTLEHVQIAGLYPCGEGAGYAGGIISSAIDGVRCAEMIAAKYK